MRRNVAVMLAAILVVGCGSESTERGRSQPQGATPTSVPDRGKADVRRVPPPKPGSQKVTVSGDDDRRVTDAMQAALDRMASDRRGKVVALMTCRAFSSRGVIAVERRMEVFEKAAADVVSDPSSLERCMGGLRRPPAAVAR